MSGTSRAGRAARRRTRLRTKVLVAGVAVLTAAPLALTAGSTASAAPVGQGFNLNASDLRFILKQIKIAEQHADTLTAANPCGTMRGNGRRPDPGRRGGRHAPLGAAPDRRHLQQPRRRQGHGRLRRPGLPAPGAQDLDRGRGRRPRRPGPGTRSGRHQLHADHGHGLRQPAPRHQQPHRRPDGGQPRRRRRRRREPGGHAVRRVLHPERRARRRPVGAVQLLVHAVRPVLRPRPRPGEQGRQRHGLHAAAAGRPAVRGGLADRTSWC